MESEQRSFQRRSGVTTFTPFELLFSEETVMPEEIKFKRTRTMSDVVHRPTEVESKDLLQSDRLKAVENLHTYQAEMNAWRDKKEKEKAFKIGDLILLRSPHRESSGKLEPKWDEPHLIAKKIGP
jgi:hypothetical protein